MHLFRGALACCLAAAGTLAAEDGAGDRPARESLPLRPAEGIELIRIDGAVETVNLRAREIIAELDRVLDGPAAPAATVRLGGARGVASNYVELPLNLWTFGPEVAPFTLPRFSLDSWGKISMQPNASTPNNSFGWIDGPAIQVDPAPAGEPGNLFGLRVTFVTPDPSTIIGLTPTLRFRLNTGDDKKWEMSGVTPLQFMAQGGTQTMTVTFDRSTITSPVLIRPSIDFINVWYGSEFVDPNFLLFIEKVEAFTTTAVTATPTPTPTPTPTATPTPTPTPAPGGSRVSAAYTEENGDLYAHRDGQTSRFLLEDDISTYAYDGAIVAAIDDNRRLYAYDANLNFERIVIEEDAGDEVIETAVAGRWVIYMEDNGKVRVFDTATRQRTTIVEDNADGVSAAGDGLTLLVLDLHNFGFDVFQHRPFESTTELRELVGDGDVWRVRGRQSRQFP
jgi:hypothetical protein